MTFSADDLDESNARQIEKALASFEESNCIHADKVAAGECTYGCCDKYRCRLCGAMVFIEVPQ